MTDHNSPDLTRRRFTSSALRLTAGASLLGAGLPAFGEAPSTQPTTQPISGGGGDSGGKMNVLFIAVDDLRAELPTYGLDAVHAPNFQRLAKRSLQFDRAYCQQAICAPSRICVMTARRPDTTGIYMLDTQIKDKHPTWETLPQTFKNAGYETHSLGKIYHHRNDDPKGWSQPAWRPTGEWFGRGYLTEEARGKINPNPGKFGKGCSIATEAADVADEAYPDGAMTVEAIKRLKNAGDKPFFMGVGFYKPHLPFNAPKRYWDLYDRDKIVLPKQTAWPEGMPNLARTNFGELRQYTDIKRGKQDEATTRRLIHGYRACVSYIDAQLGKLLDTLDETGLSKNTMIVLWGDHGWKLGEYAAWCKHTNFEVDTHAPVYVSIPGMKTAGQRTDALVEFVDIYPTITEACGLKAPDAIEGLSMMPLLADPEKPWKTAAFSQYPRGKAMGYSMRTDRWRYTEWLDKKSREINARELYDQAKGRVVTKNLASDPAHAETVAALSKKLAKGAGWKTAAPP